MENEKKFAASMFGYDKEEVDDYVKNIKSTYESKLQAEKAENNRISNEMTILKRKLEKYESDYLIRQEKVANALITAEDQSRQILQNAKQAAQEEKDKIEHLIEVEKEKLLDIKKEVIDLKERAIRLIDKYSSDMNSLLD